MNKRIKKIHVVFVTTDFHITPNGPAVYANYLWDNFQNDEIIDFHLVGIGKSYGANHPNLHLVPRHRNSISIYRAINREALKVVSNLGDPVILHVNNSHMGTVLLKTNAKVWGQVNDYQNIDVISNFFEIWKTSGLRRVLSLFRRRLIETHMVRHQDLTICNSFFTKQKVLKAYNPPHPDKVVVIYKAVDTNYFRKPNYQLIEIDKKNDRKFQLIFVGTNFINKGLDILFEALCMLNRRSVKLVIVGASYKDIKTLIRRDLIDKVGNVGHELLFKGRTTREELRNLLWESDLFVLPSRSEALGVAALEALTAGVPILTSTRGGLYEIHERLSTPDEWRLKSLLPRELSQKINTILNKLHVHKKTANLISVNKMEEIFGLNRMFEQIRRLYLKQIKDNG